MKLAIFLALIIGFIGCRSNDQDNEQAEEVIETSPETTVEESENEQVWGLANTETEDTKTSTEDGDCNKEVVAQSDGAVADPCLTTTKYMQQLGFSQQKIDNVMAMTESVGKAEGEAVAH